MNHVCFNGQFFPENTPLFTAQNRSFKYGDGVFETMKIYKATILLEQYHFERLFVSLDILKIDVDEFLDKTKLTFQILNLCKQNNCIELARIRLAVFRNENNKAGYVIEAMPLSVEANEWNKEGLKIDLYPYARKSADVFSNLKTANFLPYILADKFAKEKNLDDVIVLNAANNICDTSKANIFLIKGKDILTPALSQGCINGVMRRFLINEFEKIGYAVYQKEITEDGLYNADEVFLTNAIVGMKWVKAFRQKKYFSDVASSIYRKQFSAMYQ